MSIAAISLMCALTRGISTQPCLTVEAHQIAAAIDVTTDSDELRAQLVVSAWSESRFRIDPPPDSWDARALVSCGPLQMRCGFVRTHSVREQAREWIRNVQASSLAKVCGGSPMAARMAYRRALTAESLLATVR